MTPQQFSRLLKANQEAVKRLISRVLPVKAGRMAKDHFSENFKKGGFVDGGLHPWKPSKRIGKAKGAAGQYKTLLSGRNHLYSSIKYTPGNAKVTLTNDVPYAKVHNEGLRAGRGKGFKMPKRQFMGESKELNRKVLRLIEDEIKKILNK